VRSTASNWRAPSRDLSELSSSTTVVIATEIDW
jgi:hypothetical protein